MICSHTKKKILALEQDVSRLQEQLKAERDLQAAVEVGLSMSCGQFSSSRGMDYKQRVTELHNQLNQLRQHHNVSVSDASDPIRSDRSQHAPNQNSQQTTAGIWEQKSAASFSKSTNLSDSKSNKTFKSVSIDELARQPRRC